MAPLTAKATRSAIDDWTKVGLDADRASAARMYSMVDMATPSTRSTAIRRIGGRGSVQSRTVRDRSAHAS